MLVVTFFFFFFFTFIRIRCYHYSFFLFTFIISLVSFSSSSPVSFRIPLLVQNEQNQKNISKITITSVPFYSILFDFFTFLAFFFFLFTINSSFFRFLCLIFVVSVGQVQHYIETMTVRLADTQHPHFYMLNDTHHINHCLSFSCSCSFVNRFNFGKEKKRKPSSHVFAISNSKRNTERERERESLFEIELFNWKRKCPFFLFSFSKKLWSYLEKKEKKFNFFDFARAFFIWIYSFFVCFFFLKQAFQSISWQGFVYLLENRWEKERDFTLPWLNSISIKFLGKKQIISASSIQIKSKVFSLHFLKHFESRFF